jgi:hypothetical protein
MTHMTTPTPAEASRIQETLSLARRGGATMSQLADAHDRVLGTPLVGTLEELRTHIRRMVARPVLHEVPKHIALGMVSGVLTHCLLNMD